MHSRKSMTFDELAILAPAVTEELALEFVRRGDECYRADKTSQSDGVHVSRAPIRFAPSRYVRLNDAFHP